MMNIFLEQLADDPKGTAIGVISAIAIVGGLGIGISRGAFNPDPLQAQLETKQQNHALQKQSIALANEAHFGTDGTRLRPNRNPTPRTTYPLVPRSAMPTEMSAS